MRRFWPLWLAVSLFVLNELAVISGILHTPAGYEPNLLPRNTDSGQYLTWMNGFRTSGLLPDFHAPWHTEPALFNPILFVVSRTALALDVSPKLSYHAFHFVFHLCAAFALAYLLRVYTATRRQAVAAIVVAFLALPAQSLLVLPVATWNAIRGSSLLPPGIGDFVWWSSDGFFHGISPSLLVTFATGITLTTLACFGAYVTTGRCRYVVASSAAVFLGALAHPFEFLALVPTAAIAFPRLRGRRGAVSAGFVAMGGFLGVLPYVVATVSHSWLRLAVGVNHWTPYLPPRLLLMLGVPAMLGLALFLGGARLSRPTDLVLATWLGLVLVMLYLPFTPHSQHLLDGFHYVCAILVVRLMWQSEGLREFLCRRPRAVAVGLALWVTFSASAYVAFYRLSYMDGAAVEPRRLFSTVRSEDEAAAVRWLRGEASPNDLVLSPPSLAPWFAAVPMHNLASHEVFSLSYRDQLALSTAFFAGRLSDREASRLLTQYGVRYVVAPEGSPAEDYLVDAECCVVFDSLKLYEFPDNRMKSLSAWLADGDVLVRPGIRDRPRPYTIPGCQPPSSELHVC